MINTAIIILVLAGISLACNIFVSLYSWYKFHNYESSIKYKAYLDGYSQGIIEVDMHNIQHKFSSSSDTKGGISSLAGEVEAKNMPSV